MTDAIIETPRLLLVPVTLPIVEAVLDNRPEEVAALCQARLPNAWPGRALIERAFCASLEAIRQAPEARLWGDRIALTRDGETKYFQITVTPSGAEPPSLDWPKAAPATPKPTVRPTGGGGPGTAAPAKPKPTGGIVTDFDK